MTIHILHTTVGNRTSRRYNIFLLTHSQAAGQRERGSLWFFSYFFPLYFSEFPVFTSFCHNAAATALQPLLARVRHTTTHQTHPPPHIQKTTTPIIKKQTTKKKKNQKTKKRHQKKHQPKNYKTTKKKPLHKPQQQQKKQKKKITNKNQKKQQQKTQKTKMKQVLFQ